MGLAAVLDLDEGPGPAGTFFPQVHCSCWLPIMLSVSRLLSVFYTDATLAAMGGPDASGN